MINRILEQKIIKTVNHFPVTCIIGPRQVGKTTLAKKLSQSIDKEVIYIDLENPRDKVL
jgi:predicted AAA+ superfamily ATPase